MLTEEHFWQQVEKTNYCWNWKGSKDVSGYGEFGSRMAHRYSWTLHFGEIPRGMCICHACDNPACVNPNHLWLGTPQANTKDRDVKGHGLKGKHLPPHSIEHNEKIALSQKGSLN